MDAIKVRSGGTMTLMGEGQVRARPDMASINLGVMTTARTAVEALRENSAKMSRIAAKVKSLGITAEDMQTVGLTISPVIDYEEDSPTHGQIVSYRVEDTLNVKSDLEKAARVLDEGVAAGANVAGGLSFGLRSEAKFRQQALEGAVQAACADAQVIARSMGVTVRRPRSAEVVQGGSTVTMKSAMRRVELTTLEPGSLTISASVRVVFEYRFKR